MGKYFNCLGLMPSAGSCLVRTLEGSSNWIHAILLGELTASTSLSSGSWGHLENRQMDASAPFLFLSLIHFLCAFEMIFILVPKKEKKITHGFM